MEILGKVRQYGAEQLYSMMYQAEHNGSHVGYIRGEFSKTINGFFQEVSSAFRFPYYFGWNWAAFDECLTDLEWLSFSSLLLIIDSADLLLIKEENKNSCIDLLIKHLESAGDYWAAQGISFTFILNTA